MVSKHIIRKQLSLKKGKRPHVSLKNLLEKSNSSEKKKFQKLNKKMKQKERAYFRYLKYPNDEEIIEINELEKIEYFKLLEQFLLEQEEKYPLDICINHNIWESCNDSCRP